MCQYLQTYTFTRSHVLWSRTCMYTLLQSHSHTHNHLHHQDVARARTPPPPMVSRTDLHTPELIPHVCSPGLVSQDCHRDVPRRGVLETTALCGLTAVEASKVQVPSAGEDPSLRLAGFLQASDSPSCSWPHHPSLLPSPGHASLCLHVNICHQDTVLLR